jgi:hypothetical protein
MLSLDHALSQGLRGGAAAARPANTMLVIGGGGALGSQVLEALLARRRHAHVKVAVSRTLTTAIRGLEPVVLTSFDEPPSGPVADAAVVVFDRERHANGRELAFLQPQPKALPAIGRWLQQGGVRQLIVLLPHTPAGLPEALKQGLADLDEQAVASLGFEHLVFVRTAQAPSGPRAEAWLQRLADGVLAQLRMMVASSNQPVRANKVAQFTVELAALLPSSEPGTRVAPPELVWVAAQGGDVASLVEAWLARRELPEIRSPRRRM